jgi:hypothetical protein
MQLLISLFRSLLIAMTLVVLSGPATARFLSVDPAPVSPTDGSNFNRYWYANNNPYKYVDPDGRFPGSTEFNWENRQLGITAPPRHPDDWLGPAIGGALSVMLLTIPDPSDLAIGAAIGRLGMGLNAGRGFAQATRYIEATTSGMRSTGGRSGRRTLEAEGRGGEDAANKLFDTLTGGRSAPRDGGRLGSLGDDSRVQISSRTMKDGTRETSVRVSTVRVGSHIRESVKVRFRETE